MCYLCLVEKRTIKYQIHQKRERENGNTDEEEKEEEKKNSKSHRNI